MSDITVNPINKVEEKLPLGQLFPLGLQHVLAMYAGAIAVPLIIGGACKLDPVHIAFLVAADLFTCGIATVLQCAGIGNFVGIKLPVVMGCSFAAVGPMITIGSSHGITAVFGSIIISGLVLFLVAPLIGKITRFFPHVVTGSVLTIVGLSLIKIGINNATGAFTPGFGDPKNFALAGFVMLVIILLNRFFTGFARSISILLGILAGTLVAIPMGLVNFKIVADASWFAFVTPFKFGAPIFDPTSIFLMVLVQLIITIESMGVFFGMGDIVERPTKGADVTRGIRAEGLACMLGGIFNCFPYTTFCQNVGLVSLTRISSRFVTICAGIILIVLGLLPKFAALATIIPTPVFGGAMIIMFAMVAISGIQILGRVDYDNPSNVMVVACSIGLGLGVTVVPGMLDKFPQIIKMIFESGIVTCSITALLLNTILNYKDLKELDQVHAADNSSCSS